MDLAHEDLAAAARALDANLSHAARRHIDAFADGLAERYGPWDDDSEEEIDMEAARANAAHAIGHDARLAMPSVLQAWQQQQHRDNATQRRTLTARLRELQRLYTLDTAIHTDHKRFQRIARYEEVKELNGQTAAAVQQAVARVDRLRLSLQTAHAHAQRVMRIHQRTVWLQAKRGRRASQQPPAASSSSASTLSSWSDNSDIA